MNFFIDEHLSYRLAEALNALCADDGHRVLHVQNKFGRGVPDTLWIPGLQQEGGWVVICGDWRIRTRPAERRVFHQAKLTTFFLAKGWTRSMDYWTQAFVLVKWWPKIIQQAELVDPGALFSVPMSHSGTFKPIAP